MSVGSKRTPVLAEEAIKKLVHDLSTSETIESLKENCQELTARVQTEVLLSKEKLNRQIKSLRLEREKALHQLSISKERVKSLETELEHLQTEYKLVDRQRVKALQSQLQAANNENEFWHKRAQELEDYCETMQLVNSLHKSLSKDEEIKSEYEERIMKLKGHIRNQEDEIAQLSTHLEKVMLEYDRVSDERNALAKQLHEERERYIELQLEKNKVA
ncbi:PREDICTED: uncharacterized protein LOC105316797 [Amphimedon queenslandica]|uniref:Uncharacterized protein n=1 Tax=Amphimedon queenslandica TaxID=400682 RepID=A0A1X7VGD6_AMPQE|nr:PREDICTED: uncharacterized protein LOC105316797 [Amphimedon queenslandica]|eukprot:XP_011410299.1 PREDICTED: uncharacterized protein LOC105316797 [Amphimedon queenslandica]